MKLNGLVMHVGAQAASMPARWHNWHHGHYFVPAADLADGNADGEGAAPAAAATDSGSGAEKATGSKRNPLVFMDITIGGKPAGRITIEVRRGFDSHWSRGRHF
jgi:hypothetical protein